MNKDQTEAVEYIEGFIKQIREGQMEITSLEINNQVLSMIDGIITVAYKYTGKVTLIINTQLKDK